MSHQRNRNKITIQRKQLRHDRLVRLCKGYRQRKIELLHQQREMHKRQEELSVALKEAKYHLGRINSEIDDELETAQRIQEGLLPKELPEMINLKSAAIYIPAGKVGGDLYDIIIQ